VESLSYVLSPLRRSLLSATLRSFVSHHCLIHGLVSCLWLILGSCPVDVTPTLRRLVFVKLNMHLIPHDSLAETEMSEFSTRAMIAGYRQ
jgi:hypothetical protein